MSFNAKASYDGLSDRARKAFTDSFKSRTFQFKEDYRLVVSFQSAGSMKRIEGSWLYDHDENRLSMEADGVQRDFIVRWLDQNRIVLTYQDTEARSLLQSLCLDRQ